MSSPLQAVARELRRRAPAVKTLHQYQEAPSAVKSRVWLPPEEVQNSRALNVAVVGEPNAGKSTLVNRLCMRKISAVSAKYNTTRDRVMGIYTHWPGNPLHSGSDTDPAAAAAAAAGGAPTQLVFFDTPGFVREADVGRYHKSLVTAAKEAVPESDVVLLIVDVAKRFDDEAQESLADMIRWCASHSAGVLLVPNKCDLIHKQPLDAAQAALADKRYGSSAASVGDVESGAGPLHQQSDSGRRERQQPDLLQLKLDIMSEFFERECFTSGMLGPEGFEGKWMWMPAAEEPQEGRDAAPTVAAAAAASPTSYDSLFRRTVAGTLLQRITSIYRGVPPVHPISALHNRGVSKLRSSLLSLSLPRPWEYSARMRTDLSQLEVVEEVIREALYERLHREVPYRIRQENRSWRDVSSAAAGGTGGSSSAATTGLVEEDSAASTGGIIIIHQDIQVPSQHVARMLLGQGGSTLKHIAQSAAKQLGPLLGKRVALQLHVTVKERLNRNADSTGSA